jgi:SAM-dependent methyltransferase
MEEFRSALARQPLDRPALRVLDAGCGSEMNIELPANAHVVGIDVSSEALVQNASLDERIVGDLETIELRPKSFDLIVCWDVLEHLRRPGRVLDGFAGALAEEGLLVLGAPNVLSVKGVVTKYTPYSFHRWIYRRAASSRSAPHRTFLRLAMSPRAVRRWALRAGLTVEYLGYYEAPIQARLRQTLGLSGWRWKAIGTAVRTLSLGVIATDDSDYLAILSNRSPLAARAGSRLGVALTRS